MGRRRKRSGGLSKLASFGTHPPQKNVIKVEAQELMPIEDLDNEDLMTFDHIENQTPGGGVFSMLMGGKENLPSQMSYEVESRGKSFNDNRMFAYTEEGGKWKVVAGWTAEGSGSIPFGIKMLGSFQGIFNQLFNMITEADIEHQDVRKNAMKTFPKGLGWKKGT